METFDTLPPVHECHHPLLLTSNEKTGDLSLDKKQGHLFAQWPLATPGHTFTFLHSSALKQQGSNTWCQAHPPPLYLCRGGGRVHHHHSTFPPPPLHLHSTTTPPPSLLHLPSPWIVITSYNLKEDFATDKRLKDINSLSSVVYC